MGDARAGCKQLPAARQLQERLTLAATGACRWLPAATLVVLIVHGHQAVATTSNKRNSIMPVREGFSSPTMVQANL